MDIKIFIVFSSPAGSTQRVAETIKDCIRLCPEDAIEPAVNLHEVEERIRQRVKAIKKQPFTQIFF